MYPGERRSPSGQPAPGGHTVGRSRRPKTEPALEHKEESRRRMRWSPGLAVLVCGALVVVSGAGYRVLAARLAGVSGSVFLPPGALARLPRQIGDWSGRDEPLDQRVIQATDTDDHINRTYVRRNGSEAVSLFIGYGVRFRDLVPHRPEVCYPGAGWTLESTVDTEVTGTAGSSVPSRLYRFYRSGLQARSIAVLNYFIVDGQYCADVSLLRSKSWRARGDIRYVAQVQVVCPVGADQAAADRRVREFAAELAPVLERVLSEALRQAESAGGSEAT